MSDAIHYKQISYFISTYANAGTTDQRAVETFIECETTESVNTLRNELIGMTKGNYKDEVLDITVGVKRRLKHGSFGEWAKLMLLWIAGYKG